MRDAEAEPADSTDAGLGGREPHVLDAELGARDLQDHAADALADLGGGAVDLRRAVGEQAHARGAVVVEALRVGDVLEADGEADAALHALAPGRVPRAAGQPQRVARELLGARAARAPPPRGSSRRPAASR